jgi:hypothetical protein
MILPGTSGTIEWADRLGVVKFHPRVWRSGRISSEPVAFGGTPESMQGIGAWEAAPWVGDLLLYLRDDEGPYMVEWDFKDLLGQHGEPNTWQLMRNPKRARQLAEARELVYRAYMDELHIPIVRLARDSFPCDDLINNLNDLFLRHHLSIDLPPNLIADLIGTFEMAIDSGDAPMKYIDQFAARGMDRDQGKRVFEQAVWEGKLLVDWFEPIAVDQPLWKATRDVGEEFAGWFARYQ